jgi:hypothetical protein
MTPSLSILLLQRELEKFKNQQSAIVNLRPNFQG